MTPKATPQQIRERFDNDVERFSNLETGQTAAVDSPLGLELIAHSAAAVNPGARSLLDIGCGAGNYSLKLLESLPDMDVTLVDLSLPMIERARLRIEPVTRGRVAAWQGDIRTAALPEAQFDVAVAAAVLHHLRAGDEWHAVFEKVFRSLRPGGSFWIFDMIRHQVAGVESLMWDRYAQYLTELQGDEYRRRVFDYIEFEDTPRPLVYQLDLLRRVGFAEVEVLHKNSCFAAFGAIRA